MVLLEACTHYMPMSKREANGELRHTGLARAIRFRFQFGNSWRLRVSVCLTMQLYFCRFKDAASPMRQWLGAFGPLGVGVHPRVGGFNSRFLP